MSNKEVRDFTRKIEAGLHLAERRMPVGKALRGATVVVSTSAGKTACIPAREVLATY